MSNRAFDPGQVSVVTELLHGARGDLNPRPWADAVMSSTDLLPTDNHELGQRAAVAVLRTDGLDEGTLARANLLASLCARPVDDGAVLSAARRLVAAGDPAGATLAFGRLARRARVAGWRATGELLCQVSLAILDSVDSQPPLDVPVTGTGRDRDAEELSRIWVHVMRVDPSGVAEMLPSSSIVEEVDEPDPVFRPAVQLAQLALTAGQEQSRDLAWLRGRALRGLAFAVRSGGENRFAAYAEYGRARSVGLAFRNAFAERHSHALTMTGRLNQALEVLDGATAECGPELAGYLVGAQANLYRAYARNWRIAGDPYRALSYSDRAVALLEPPTGQELDASTRGGIWLNRSAIELDLGEHSAAYRSATRALTEYSVDDVMAVGQAEAQEMQCAADLDKERAAQTGHRLVARHEAGQLPQPVRSSCLWRSAQAIAVTDPAEALRVYRMVLSIAQPGRRALVNAGLDGGRLVLEHADEPALVGEDAIAWAEAAAAAALAQDNRLLVARSRLFLARVMAARPGRELEAAALGRQGLEDLTATLSGLTADGGQLVVSAVREDLRALFDLAVHLDDGPLAMTVAEAGRAARLVALLRLDPSSLPPAVRRALADAATANLAEQGGTDSDDSDPHSREIVRTVAAQALKESRGILEDVCGSIIREVATEPTTDLESVRGRFPHASLVTLAESGGVLRWTWWPPRAPRPRCGSHRLSRRALRILQAYANGNASLIPADSRTPLAEFLPPPLVAELSVAGPARDVLISPAGWLWHLPFVAAPLDADGERLLVHAARVSLTPSLNFCRAVSEQNVASLWQPSEAKVAVYCNPNLPGAKAEGRTVRSLWPKRRALPGVRALGLASPAELAIVATHATADAGLSQAIKDHAGQRLSAGECIVRHFPRTVFLGTCHGYVGGSFRADEDPIGLLTVISARGATWVVGGYQRIDDVASGYLLSDTYRRMAAGSSVSAALRDAQLAYLETVGRPDLDGELAAIVDVVGVEGARQPWFWAMTVGGPPGPARTGPGASELAVGVNQPANAYVP